MPRLTITREQRDALYQQVRNHLVAIGDLAMALEQDHDIDTAERLGRRFAEDLRLLEDLGWEPVVERPSFCLTMPVADLRRVLMRLQAEAEGGAREPEDERRAREVEDRAKAAFVAARDTCCEILDTLDVQGGGQPAACS